MIEDDVSKKGVDQPDLDDWHLCREYRLRKDETAGDNLNGSIPLDRDDLEAVGADLGGQIKLHAEAGEHAIDAQKEIYSSQPGVGLQKDERERLGLDVDNNSIKYWIKNAHGNGTKTDNAALNRSNNADTGRNIQQEPLIEDKNTEQQYVWFKDANSATYHHIGDSEEPTTICGINFKNKSNRIFTDPGDVLDECKNCAVRTSDEMTNSELARWIANQADFDTEGGPPGYFNKSQLLSLRDYIVELQNDQIDGEDPNESV